jgi:hypothetical protein
VRAAFRTWAARYIFGAAESEEDLMSQLRWETAAGRPTAGLLFAQISEKLRELQDLTAMMGHIQKENGNELVGQGWLGVSEMMQMTLHSVVKLGKRGLQ